MKVVATLLALTAVAHADDPAVERANEANLESKDSRQGIQLSAAIGGALTLGFSMTNATGTGGALTFRIGEPMTPSWVLTVELAGGGQLHRFMDGTTNLDSETVLAIGAMYYPADSFFVRAGFGIGTYLEKMVPPELKDHKYAGPGFTYGAGIELVRVKHFVLDLELFGLAIANRDGLLVTQGLGLGGTFH